MCRVGDFLVVEALVVVEMEEVNDGLIIVADFLLRLVHSHFLVGPL